MVKSILANNQDIHKVIRQIKDSRIEYQAKSQHLQDELIKYLGILEVGMILEAKEDCMGNFRKGQRVDITQKGSVGFIVDGVVDLEEDVIRRYFRIV